MTDEEVLDQYERTVDGVYRYASRLTGGDRGRADELVQETYLHLLRRVRAGDPLVVDQGWLILSCRHRFLDQLKQDRRRRVRERRSGTPTASGGEGGGSTLDGLDRLPPDQRAVLVLRYVDGFAVGEIASEIGRSVRHLGHWDVGRRDHSLAGSLVPRIDGQTGWWSPTLDESYTLVDEGWGTGVAKRTVRWNAGLVVAELNIVWGSPISSDPWSPGAEVSVTDVRGAPALAFWDGTRAAITWSPAPDVTVKFGLYGSLEQALAIVRSIEAVDAATWESASRLDTSPRDGCNSVFC